MFMHPESKEKKEKRKHQTNFLKTDMNLHRTNTHIWLILMSQNTSWYDSEMTGTKH